MTAREDTEWILGWWTATEIAVVLALFVLLAASVFGGGGFLASVPGRIRLAALDILAVESLIPVWVFVDVCRRSDDPSARWVHAAAMPVVNLVGLLANLEERNRGRRG